MLKQTSLSIDTPHISSFRQRMRHQRVKLARRAETSAHLANELKLDNSTRAAHRCQRSLRTGQHGITSYACFDVLQCRHAVGGTVAFGVAARRGDW